MKSEICTIPLSRFLRLLKLVDGQDLVEYALVVALIALSATAGMKSLATKIDSAFTSLGTQVNSNVG